MSKKRKTRDKEKQRGPKTRYTNRANVFYQEEIAPMEKALKQALATAQYKNAETLFLNIRTAKKKHRTLLVRREFVKIK